MKTQGLSVMGRTRLEALLGKFPGIRVAVAGDLFLDRWLFIDPALNEPSLETGLPAWQVVRDRRSAGAAGTVLNNLSALGVGSVAAISMLGEDGAGRDVELALQERGVNTRDVLRSRDIVTPQYIKPMLLSPEGTAAEQNRVDVKNQGPTPGALEERLCENLSRAAETADALILLDQLAEEDRGVLTRRVREHAVNLAEQWPGLLVFADSRAFLHRFRGVTVKCNNLEAARLANRVEGEAFNPENVFRDLERLMALTGKPAFVTCGRHGIAAGSSQGNRLVPAVRHSVPLDPCGAGDAATSGIVCALCAGADPGEAAFVGNLAAGVTVRKIGDTGTASPEEILCLYDEQYAGGTT